MRMQKITMSILFGSLLCGCATTYNPATGRQETIWVSSETEREIGANMHNQLVQEPGLSSDDFQRQRVENIGNRMAAVSDRKDVEYKFYLLDDESFNAMATPGGWVYVNSGLARLLNDDELSYVIGHEVGHQAARHIAKKIQAGMSYQLIMTAALIGMGDAGQSAAGAVQAVDTVYNLIELGYSRQDEYEADRIGVRYSRDAGYDPYGALNALEKIKKEEGPNWKVLGYFRSHPYADDRIEALKIYIPQLEKDGKN